MMQIGIAVACGAIPVVFAASYPQFAVPSAIRDAAEFLRVDMHQFPGGGFLIPDRGWFSHTGSGLVFAPVARWPGPRYPAAACCSGPRLCRPWTVGCPSGSSFDVVPTAG